MTPYQAPFPDEDSSNELIIPLSYIIYLFPGRSIEDLNNAIARDVKPFVGMIVHSSRVTEQKGLFFTVNHVQEELLQAIRSYQGVRLVERDYKLKPAST
jgi:hypothetical protein